MNRNLYLHLLVMCWIIISIHTGCGSGESAKPTIEQTLDSAFQQFLGGKDSVPIERKLIAMGSRDTLWLNDLIQSEIDSLNARLTHKDSIIKQASDFEKSADYLEGILPVDAQGMRIQATRMKLDILNWEHLRDSLETEKKDLGDTREMHKISCTVKYQELKGEASDTSEYYVRMAPNLVVTDCKRVD